MKDLPCEIVQDLLPTYVDGLTSPVTNEAVQAHLETCPACRESWRRMSDKNKLSPDKPCEMVVRLQRKVRRRKLRIILLCVFGVLFAAVAVRMLCFPIKTTQIQKDYSGVWESDVLNSSAANNSVTASLDYTSYDYLILKDRCKIDLAVQKSWETIQFHFESEMKTETEAGGFSVWGGFGIRPGGSLMPTIAQADPDMGRICIENFEGLETFKLVSGTVAEEEIDSLFEDWAKK